MIRMRLLYKRFYPLGQSLLVLLGIVCLCFLTQAVYAADATDPLAGAATAVKADFGPTSNFMTIVYVVEVVMAVVGYIKTKNLLTLIGLPVILIFTALASKMITGG